MKDWFVIIQSTLDEGTEPWGVMVERVEVKDVRVPEQLQRAMAAEAEAAREARAKVIAAEGEHKASRALRQAAEVIIDSPAALQVATKLNLNKFIIILFSQLRYLQTLNSISAENNSTIIFPVPIDIMNSFMQNGQTNQYTQQYQQFQNFQQRQTCENFQQQRLPSKEQHLPVFKQFPGSKTTNKYQVTLEHKRRTVFFLSILTNFRNIECHSALILQILKYVLIF